MKKTMVIFGLSLGVLACLWLAMHRIPALALALDRTVGAPLRSVLSRLSSLFRPSLAEWCILLLPLFLILLILAALSAAKSQRASRRLANGLLCFLLSFLAVYVLAFAPGQLRPKLTDALRLSDAPPTADEVLSCVSWLSALAEEKPAYPGDAAVEEGLRTALGAAGERYGFTANTAVSVKKSATPLFLRLGYFGLYAFPFGEITLTVACPEATRAFTLAHEMAHASGFSREEEADAIALLTCLDSGDRYLISAAATGMLGRAMCALYEYSPALWERASAIVPDTARRELSDAGDVYEHGMAETGATVAEDYGAALFYLCAIHRAYTIT